MHLFIEAVFVGMASSSRSSTNQSDLLRPNEYKVILIGDVGVGKTSLLTRYVHNSFEETTTKFISEEKKDITINGQKIVLHLWDTAGVLQYVYISYIDVYIYLSWCNYPVYTYTMLYLFTSVWANNYMYILYT